MRMTEATEHNNCWNISPQVAMDQHQKPKPIVATPAYTTVQLIEKATVLPWITRHKKSMPAFCILPPPGIVASSDVWLSSN